MSYFRPFFHYLIWKNDLIFAGIYAQLLIRDEEENARRLKQSLKRYLDKSDIAFCYGKLTKEDKLPVWANQRLLEEESYLRGTASTDNLELFIEVYNRFDHTKGLQIDRKSLLKEVVKSCSRKILEHMQLEEKDLDQFLYSNRNVEAVEFLLATTEPTLVLSSLQRRVVKQFCTSLHHTSLFIPYARACLQKGWIVIPEETWQKVSEKVREQFSSDV